MRQRPVRTALCSLFLIAPLLAGGASAQAGAEPPFPIERGDRIVLIGNTLAERMQLFPHFEGLLTSLHPGDSLTFRNMAWSADEVDLQPRPLNFGDLHAHLGEQGADVIFAAFGANESFAGEAGLPDFRVALDTLLQSMQARRYNGAAPPRIVLLSPIAQERVERVPADVAERNRLLALYTEAMREVAARRGVRFVDLFAPTRPLMEDPSLGDLTINGIHLEDRGYEVVSKLIASSLGWPSESTGSQALRDEIREKNEIFFLRWRAVNGEYIYGRRKEPFGVVNFPGEMRQLEEMIRTHEQRIWRTAREDGN